MSLTKIADTIRSANGDIGGLDRIQITWTGFFNAANQFIPAETLVVSATITGSFSMLLEPSVSGPYTIVYIFKDGTTQADFWNVPSSGSTLRICDVHVSGPSVSSSLILALSQIAQGGASIGQVLVWNGSTWAPGSTSNSELVNAQSGTLYTFVAGDVGKLVTFSNSSAIAVSLPQATGTFGAGWFTEVQNVGAGIVTITPTISTIGGAATSALMQGQTVKIISDGTNYLIIKSPAGANTGSPSISAGSGAGTSPTISVSGSNLSGTITLTTGTSPVGSAIIGTVTFASPWATTPSAVMGSSVPIDWTTSTTTLVFRAGPEGLLPSTSYSFTYVCFGA